MARLGDHPHVVTVYDAVEDAGALHIVARYMAGGSLAERLAAAPGGRLPVAEVLRTGRALADALAHAHAHGVVHRDVKPDNVWLAADGSAGLGDFGIAVVAGDAPGGAGAATGTPYYQAPEQARGRPRRCRRPTSTRSARRCGSCCAGGRRSPAPDAAALLAQHRDAEPEPPVAPRAGRPARARRARARAARQAPGGPPGATPPRCATRSTALGGAPRVPVAARGGRPRAARRPRGRAGAACARALGAARGGSAARRRDRAASPGSARRASSTRRRPRPPRAARRWCAAAPARSRAPTARGAPRCARSSRRPSGLPAPRARRRAPPHRATGRAPERAAAAPPGGEEARLRMFDAVVALVRAAARERGLFVALEDVHAADRSSLALLGHLLARRAGRAAAGRADLPRGGGRRGPPARAASSRRSSATAG